MIKEKTISAGNKNSIFYWHYAWVIVVIIAGMQIVGTSIRMAFGVFIDPLEQQFQWSQGGIGFTYALCSIVSALVSPWAGNIGDRFGARRAMIFGTSLFLVGMILTAFITELWHFWITYGLVLGVAQAIFLVPLIPAAMIWFRRHLGLAMGLVMASWGLGPALATPLIAYMLEVIGWKASFLILGMTSFVLMLIMIAIFRNRPGDISVLAYGTEADDPPLSDRLPPLELLEEFKGHMRKTAAYWNMSSIHFLGCVGHAVILIWIIPMATQGGLTLVGASLIITVMSVVSIVTRLTTPIHLFCFCSLRKYRESSIFLLLPSVLAMVGKPGDFRFSTENISGMPRWEELMDFRCWELGLVWRWEVGSVVRYLICSDHMTGH